MREEGVDDDDFVKEKHSVTKMSVGFLGTWLGFGGDISTMFGVGCRCYSCW